MFPKTKPLFKMTAADLMSESLVAISDEMTLRGAARLLAKAAVTGAPVVDKSGRCVGVLSATDFVHWMSREHRSVYACAVSPAFFASWQMLESEELPDETVRDCMTRDPVCVVASTTIGEVARKMIDAHIHRVIVVNDFDKPIGLVSSTDLLAALAQADPARQTGIPAGVN